MSTREQIVRSTAELRKLIDRLERDAVDALEHPSMERLAAIDSHRRVIDSTLVIIRRAVQRQVEREQSRTEPEDEAAETGPHPQITKRPTTRPK